MTVTCKLPFLRALIAAAVIAMVAGLPAEPVQASEREFARDMVERFKGAVPEASFEIDTNDPLEISVKGHPQWDEATINLHRVFGFCQTAQENECAAELDRFVAAFSRQEANTSRGDLRIIVRDAEYWSYIQPRLSQAGQSHFHRPIGDDLIAIVALDSPDSIRIATQADLDDFGLSPKEVWGVAEQQTLAVIPAVPGSDALASSWIAFESEEYLGSLLYFTDQWARLAEAAGPDMFVTVTSDQFVLAGILPDGEELDELKPLVAQDCAEASRCISANVYRFRDGQWVIAD